MSRARAIVPATGLAALLTALLAGLWSGQLMAASELPIDLDWYTVEVLIFDNPTRPEDSDEQLATSAPRVYPANLLVPAFADVANPGGGFAPLGAEPEPWPEPPPPATDDWFGDPLTDPADPLGPADPSGPADDSPGEQGSGEQGSGDEPADEPADVPAESLSESVDGGPSESVDGDETPPDQSEPPLTPRQLLEQTFAQALVEYQSALAADAYRWRSDPTQLALTDQGALLSRREVGRTLAHGAWLQPIPGRGKPQPILIQSNEAIADRWRIEGTLAVTLGRFLHVAAKLWYQPEPSLVQESDRSQGWFSITDDTSQGAAVLAGIPFDLDDAVDPELPYQVLSELRRMRGGELHYLDHPSFGLLIQVVPVEPPAELVELFQQLEEGVE